MADATSSTGPTAMSTVQASSYRRQAVTIDGGDSIAEAARLMRTKHVGFLVVTSGAAAAGPVRVAGVLTDRDIVVAVVARDADPKALKVEDVMTRSPLLARVGQPTDVVLRFMSEAGVRRVPLVGDQGELVGVLSTDDVLEMLAEELASLVRSIRCGQQTERFTRP